MRQRLCLSIEERLGGDRKFLIRSSVRLVCGYLSFQSKRSISGERTPWRTCKTYGIAAAPAASDRQCANRRWQALNTSSRLVVPFAATVAAAASTGTHTGRGQCQARDVDCAAPGGAT